MTAGEGRCARTDERIEFDSEVDTVGGVHDIISEEGNEVRKIQALIQLVEDDLDRTHVVEPPAAW